MAQKGLSNFQNLILGAAGVVAFVVKATKARPSFLEVLAFAGELSPFAQIDYSQVVPEALDIDADENAAFKDAIDAKLAMLPEGKAKDASIKIIAMVQPGVEFVKAAIDLVTVFKGSSLADATPAVATETVPTSAPSAGKAKR